MTKGGRRGAGPRITLTEGAVRVAWGDKILVIASAPQPPDAETPADFTVDMSADQWDRFLQGRRSGTGRTLVEIDNTDDVVKAINPRKKLDFLRYHTSLQAFFDAGLRADSPQAA